MSYGVILQILGGAASKAALAGDYRRALIIAESQLDFAAANITSGGAPTFGKAQDRFQWQVSYQPTHEYFLEGVPVRYTPVTINVHVSWTNKAGAERSVDLSTVRLARGRVS